jgi:hypothetical protein
MRRPVRAVAPVNAAKLFGGGRGSVPSQKSDDTAVVPPKMRRLVSAVALFAIFPFLSAAARGKMDSIAEAYVKLGLALGQHDAHYVDAYYGPAWWKDAAAREKKSLDTISAEAKQLREVLETKMAPPAHWLSGLRHKSLIKQLTALEARVRIVKGERLQFDDESRLLYDAVAPTFSEAHFQEILNQLEAKLPGPGSLVQRYEKWQKPFAIPKAKLDGVFQLAIKECRARTLAQIKLPPNETFSVEYVTGKPWSGYNWYKGNYRSVIQVNTDLPVYIDRAIDLAAHEGYPGHHVYNVLLEKNLLRDRGWIEFSIYPLFSPQSLIAEGTANFGKDVVFTKAERIKFEKEVLFPAAAVDPARAEEYYAVQELVKKLAYARNEAARRLINGEINSDAAMAWLEKFALTDPARARQSVRFIERYHSYVINYNLGEDLVRNSIEKHGGTDADPGKRWQVFEQLLKAPHVPSQLQ